MAGLRMVGDWSIRRGMLLAGCTTCAAVIAALYLPPFWRWFLLFALVLLLAVLLIVPGLRHPVALFCVAVMLLSVGRAGVYTWSTVPDVDSLQGVTDNIVGEVEACPSSGRMYTVRVTKATHLAAGMKVLLFCDDRAAPYYGETVSAEVEYRLLYDSQQYHRSDEVYLQAYPVTYGDDSVQVVPSDGAVSWTQVLRPLRQRLTKLIREVLPGQEGALVTAMCLGDKSSLGYRTADAFRGCGLPHLLAVSGLHLAVLAGALQSGLRRLRLRRIIIGIVTSLFIFMYMWLIEFTPSVTRSGLMYIVMLMGLLVRRQSDGLNSLGLALMVVLMASPSAIYDLGFWFSFGATAGLLLFYTRLRGWLRSLFRWCPAWIERAVGTVTDSVAVTLSATLPLIPVMAFFFHEIAIVAPLSNLLTLLPAGGLLTLGFTGVLLRGVGVLTSIGELLLLLAGLMAKYLIHVAGWLASLPGALIAIRHLWQVLWLAGTCLLMGITLARFHLGTLRRIWCACLVVLLMVHSGGSAVDRTVTTVSIHNVEGKAVVVVEHNGRGMALAQDLGGVYSARMSLENDGYRTADFLVLGDGSPYQSGQLSEWREAYPHTEVYLYGRTASFTRGTTVTTGDTLVFWEDHSLRLLSDGWWLLSVRNTKLLIAPYRRVMPPEEQAAAYVLLEAALPKQPLSVAAPVILVRYEEEGKTTHIHGNVQSIADHERYRLITDGTGQWKIPIT